MIGRSAGREQADGRIYDRLLVDTLAERAIVIAIPANGGDAMHGGAGQLAAQLGAGIDESRARHVQAHHFHHHLVGIGGAVEGAGARAMIAGALALQQLLAPNLALGIELADALLLLVGEA